MIYPRIIAHRCGGALAPENTLAGLRIAARLGCKAVEFDAMLSADGEPVLIHDDRLERTTNGVGEVATFALERLRSLDAGLRHHLAYSNEPVPSLRDALALCTDLGLMANIEIKPSPGREKETGRNVAIVAAAVPGQHVLSSFSMDALNEAKHAADHYMALLVESIPPDWWSIMQDTGVKALHAEASQLLMERSRSQLRELKDRGIQLASYTVNNRRDAEALDSLGVTTIFTDRPDLWRAEEM